MSLTELPFGLSGRLFRSPMPFGPYDLHGEVYDRFRQEQISVIVLLATVDECLYKTGRNLRALYLREGWTVRISSIIRGMVRMYPRRHRG